MGSSAVVRVIEEWCFNSVPDPFNGPLFHKQENDWETDMGTSAVVRVIKQSCFNSVPDPFNGQTVNFILKPPKVIESRT